MIKILLPTNDIDLSNDFEVVEQPSKTYRLLYQKNKLSGDTDEIEALKQAIYFILNTERYDYLIYDWDYGFEIKDLVGQDPRSILPEIQKRICDALMQDTRITEITDFKFNVIKNKVSVLFAVKSIFGDINQNLDITL